MGSLDSCFRRSNITEWLLERPKRVAQSICSGTLERVLQLTHRRNEVPLVVRQAHHGRSNGRSGCSDLPKYNLRKG